MGKKYCISSRTAKHSIATKIYKIDKFGGVALPDTCKWDVCPSVHKTVELNLSDFSKGSKYPHFSAVMSSLTIKEAIKLSNELKKAAKAAKECPPKKRREMEKSFKDLKAHRLRKPDAFYKNK
jgi:hypothetical protein